MSVLSSVLMVDCGEGENSVKIFTHAHMFNNNDRNFRKYESIANQKNTVNSVALLCTSTSFRCQLVSAHVGRIVWINLCSAVAASLVSTSDIDL